jgi:DNA-binding MarR family transcriptional regulator
MGKKDTHYCNCLYYTANALARVMTRLAEEEFAVLGLTPSYAFLIITVHDKPGIQPGEISDELQLTPSTVTRLIEKLESKDLLIRRTLGKFTEVTLTPRGIEMTEVIRTCWENLNKRYTEILGEEDARELSGKIYCALKKLDKKNP